jgi:RNA polymerase sigma factor (sigma-70 family)
VEASTLQAPAVRTRSGPSIGVSLLRLRSDEQLIALFRAGNDDAFRAIHDRYRQRLFAYTRQMLSGRQDAEDALQDVFVRAYSGLRANSREVALRAWLYRVAHNRCVDELRRPLISPAEVFEMISAPDQDPVAQADQRESLRRLLADVRRLPRQQRSALLMRELSGMSYAELAEALETTVPAVKSLLVRARMALALALQARETACAEIREELVLAQDRRVRPGAMAKRHMRDCAGCRDFRRDLRGVSRELAALTPALGPLGVVAKLLGLGFGGSAGGGAAVGSGTAVAGGSAAGGAVGSGGMLASAGALATSAGHVATLIVATVVTAGGAVEIQQTIAPPPAHHQHHARHAATTAARPQPAAPFITAGDPVATPAPLYTSASVPQTVVVRPAASSAPAPPSRVTTSGPARAGKNARVSKASTPTSTPASPAAGSDSTTSTGPGAPVADSTSVTGVDSTGNGAAGSSTSTGTGTAQSTGSDGAGTSGSTQQPASASGSGSSSTGSTAGSGTGTGETPADSPPTSS